MRFLKRILMILVLLCLVVSAFAQAEKPPERLAEESKYEGDTAFNARDFNKSIENHTEALRIYKELNTESQYNAEIESILMALFYAEYGTRKFQLAVQHGEEYLKLNDTNMDIIRALATIYRANLQLPQKAIEVWQRYDEKYNNFIAKQAIGDLYAGINDLDNAILWYQRANTMNPDADVIRKLAKAYLDKKDNANAIKAYQDFINTNPSRRELATTYRNLGTLYNDLNNKSAAIQNYERAIELNWERNIAYFLADAYYTQGDYTKALQHLDTIISRNARDNDAIYLKAMSLYTLNRHREAKVEFQKITNHGTYGSAAQRYIELIDNPQ